MCEEVIPCYVKLALRANKGYGTDRAAGSRGIVGSCDGEGCAMIRGMRNANSACVGAAAGCVPGGGDVGPKWAIEVPIDSDHRLVVEMILTGREAEEGRSRETPTAIDGLCYRHFSAVDAVASSEENDDVAVKQISSRIEYQTRI